MPSISLRRRLVVLLLAALAALVTLPSLAGAEGMTVDPNGRTTPQASNPTCPSYDAGMLIDPDGAH